jgi:hypothetical protein
MLASKSSKSIRLFVVALTFLSTFAVAQQSDQLIAARVLGPQWKQLSRRAGMIFAGTVLTSAKSPSQTPVTDRSPTAIPEVRLSFRIDQAIAGVKPGQLLTIHEWAGAASRQLPMNPGQHLLIFLYPPSRLGLTSPVGGALGQIALDPAGQHVIDVPLTNQSDTRRSAGQSRNQSAGQSNDARNSDAATVSSATSSLPPGAPAVTGNIRVTQLARAIRSAREE